MKKNKVVYLHRKRTNGDVFYVGIGNPNRPYQKAPTSRSVVWHRVVNKHGYYIEIIREGLSKKEACEIEVDLIELIGRRDKGSGTLVNLTDGGEGNLGSKANNKEILCLETGKIYQSIKDYCRENNKKHSSVSGSLCSNSITDHRVRFVEDNKIVWIDEFDDINRLDYEEIESTYIMEEEEEEERYNNEQLNLIYKRLNNLLPYNYKLFTEFAYENKSLRVLGKEYGVSFGSIFHSIKNIREYLINGICKPNITKECIYQYNFKGEIINRFDSLKEAANKIKKSEKYARQVLDNVSEKSGIRFTCGGFILSSKPIERDYFLIYL